MQLLYFSSKYFDKFRKVQRVCWTKN